MKKPTKQPPLTREAALERELCRVLKWIDDTDRHLHEECQIPETWEPSDEITQDDITVNLKPARRLLAQCAKP